MTSELSGAALDWAVANCEGLLAFGYRCEGSRFAVRCSDGRFEEFDPTNWAEGGLIIERERIYLQPEIGKEGAGNAWYAVSMYNTDAYGSTPLSAAMRCYVASKLGDEVEVPETLEKESA